MSLLDRLLCCSGGSGREGMGKVLVFFLYHIISTFFPLLDAVVVESRLQLQGLETVMILKQESVTLFLTFLSEFLRA